MNKLDLHDVIVEILQRAGEPLSVRQIWTEISEGKLWYRPVDNKIPPISQIHARVNNYEHLFAKEGNVVSLKETNPQQKRLLRITWNESNWELPSGHKWRKKDQGNSNIAYENQYGFGGEEWLFNSRYYINGFQYGYIRGLLEVRAGTIINEAYLFTIDQNTKDRYLVCMIKDLEVLDATKIDKKVIAIYKKYADSKLNEIDRVNGDTDDFFLEDFYPVVRFKMENVHLFDEPLPINELKKGNKYNRFKPYIIDSTLENLLNGIIPRSGFIFSPGKRKVSKLGHARRTESQTIQIADLHKQIVNDIELYLNPEYTIAKENISIEKSMFGYNIADVVLKEKNNSYSIIEIKTSNNVRFNIREALGQLLDYAIWSTDLKVHRLIIVSPSALKEEYVDFFNRMKSAINLTVEYWQYCENRDVKLKLLRIV